MLCAVIKGPGLEDAHRQVAQSLPDVDCFEFRLDYFRSRGPACLQELMIAASRPVIFTLRSSAQGGVYEEPEKNRLLEIRRLAALKPAYFDLESHIPETFIRELKFAYPSIQLILSTHNFHETPGRLKSYFKKNSSISFTKLACQATNTNDALRLLCFAKDQKQLIPISLGPFGTISRILAPVIGSPLTYAAVSDDADSHTLGQLSVKTLVKTYGKQKQNGGIYGLIGDPVEQSISDKTHNQLMHLCQLEAIYLKMVVKVPELAEFIALAKQLPFRGLSVTMPLKEAIIPHLDQLDPKAASMGAVNTLLFENGKIIGYNTDGIGALRLIEELMAVQGKKILIIGAGGAAKAIAHEAFQRGAIITILNRDPLKAKQLADRLSCRGFGLDQMESCYQSGYDLLINCTPDPLPIDPLYIIPETMVMDIQTRPKERALLKKAQEKGCRIIYGYQLFIAQAEEQFNIWFKERITREECLAILKQKALECLL